MTNLLAGVLSALLGTNQPAVPAPAAGPHAATVAVAVNTNDPVEKEYQQIMAEDDAAEAEVDEWIKENQKFEEAGSGLAGATLRPRIKQRLEPVRKRYEEFLERHPNHVNARIAFGSFLGDIGEEEAGSVQWLKAREIDPRNPAVWNNLGNYYGHNGGISNSFVCYTRAIELDPRESVYYQNLAIITYMFRQDAQAAFGLTLPQVFDTTMALYRKALALDPQNFELATELAQTYYGFKPPTSDDPVADSRALQKHYDTALAAWQVALKLAHDEIEREGIFIHFARVNISAGRFDEARRQLNLVTNAMYNTVKETLQKNIVKKDTKALSVPPVTLRPEAK